MAVQHTPFDALAHDGPLLGLLVRQAFRWYQEGVRARMVMRGEPPLSLMQCELFMHVELDGISIAELARRMGVTRQSAHQAVRELVQAGILNVGPDPSSGRSKLIRPTSDAMDKLRVVREVLAEIDQQLTERLGPRQIERLRAILGSDWGTPGRA